MAIIGLKNRQNTKHETIDNLETEEYLLFGFSIDESGSMSAYETAMRAGLEYFKKKMEGAKEENQILVAGNYFGATVELGGYRRIKDFDTTYSAKASYTRMYDCIIDGKKELLQYRKTLKDNGYRVKTIFVVYSDGQDNGSKFSKAEARVSVNELNDKECITLFVAYGKEALKEAEELEFKNIIEMTAKNGNSLTEKEFGDKIKEVFGIVSKSAIDVSKNVIASGNGIFGGSNKFAI